MANHFFRSQKWPQSYLLMGFNCIRNMAGSTYIISKLIYGVTGIVYSLFPAKSLLYSLLICYGYGKIFLMLKMPQTLLLMSFSGIRNMTDSANKYL